MTNPNKSYVGVYMDTKLKTKLQKLAVKKHLSLNKLIISLVQNVNTKTT